MTQIIARRILTFVWLIAVLSLAIVFWKHPIFPWLELHLGVAKGGPDPWYNFWSGFGSDIGEATILVAIIGAARHHNCHVKGCLRLGRPVDGTPYVACPKHHPEHKGNKRGVSVETIEAHFRRSKEKV